MSFDALTIKQLRAFKAYIEQGTVVKAADLLNVTPPAITIQVKALEALSGATLYKHVNKKTRLTDTGKRVLELADTLTKQIDAAAEQLEDIRYARRGSVRLGIVSTAKYFIPSAIAGFRKAHPGIDVSLFIGNRTTVMKQLEEGAIDLAITGRPRGDFAETSVKVCNHPYVIIAAADNPLVKRKNLTLFDLQHQEFLLREEGSGSRALMESVFAIEGFSIPVIGLEADSNETIKQGVMAGLGVAFMSGHTIYQETESGRLVILDIKGFPIVRAWYAVENPTVAGSAATTALRDFIIETAPNFVA
ncbi:MAG: LysR family transcriptional regulator [Rhizobiaceae bacterium]